MSWHYLAEPAADSSPVCCTDGEPLPPSKSRTTRAEFYCNGKLTESYLDSLYGTTCVHSTGSPGEGKSTSLVEGSHVRTSAQQEKAQGSRASDPAYGPKWRELSMMYDPVTFTLKTHHCLFSEDLPLSCATLPKWGSMRDGVLWGRMTSPLDTAVKGVGFMGSIWPTPISEDAKHAAPTEWELSTEHCATKNSLHVKAHKATYPTPAEHEARLGYQRRDTGKKGSQKSLTTIVVDRTGGPGKVPATLSPDWVEWLMGWPIGWTDLEPMSRDDFNRWKSLTMSGEWFLVDPADDGTTPRICSGVSDRAKRLKAIGNGQVPLCAATAWSILSGENEPN